MTPGFTMSLRTRPLVVNKFREYVGDRSVTIRSKRLLRGNESIRMEKR
jgi:hypothetical protein